METEQGTGAEVEHQVYKGPTYRIWMSAPPREELIKRLNTFCADIERQLSLNSVGAEAFSVEVVTDADGEMTGSIYVRLAPDPLVTP